MCRAPPRPTANAHSDYQQWIIDGEGGEGGIAVVSWQICSGIMDSDFRIMCALSTAAKHYFEWSRTDDHDLYSQWIFLQNFLKARKDEVFLLLCGLWGIWKVGGKGRILKQGK